MSYSDAKKFCKSLDNRAHLVEIRSQEIQNFDESLDLSSNGVWWMGATHQEKVKFLIKTYKYISLTLSLSFHLQEGHWVWENSGIPLTFTNWKSGGDDRNENCGEIYKHGIWNDILCDRSDRDKPLCQILI